MMMHLRRRGLLTIAMSSALTAMLGCTQRPPFVPNPDPALHKNASQFAADAAHRHYETDAPKAGEANGRVEIDYGLHRVQIANSSTEDWNDIEVWVNQKYVVALPKIPGKASRAESIDFQMIFDEHGNHLPFNGEEEPVNTVEMYKDGKMYSLGSPRLAD
jgi:hypothetical protein